MKAREIADKVIRDWGFSSVHQVNDLNEQFEQALIEYGNAKLEEAAQRMEGTKYKPTITWGTSDAAWLVRQCKEEAK